MQGNDLLSFRKPYLADEEHVWDRSRLLVCELDSNGNIANVDENFSVVTGYTREDLVNQPFFITLHDDMPKVILRTIWMNISAGKDYLSVTKNVTKEGSYFWTVSSFEIKENSIDNVRYIVKQRHAPKEAVTKYFAPLYANLQEIEGIGGNDMELSLFYFKNFLEKEGKTYIEYVISSLEEVMKKDVKQQSVAQAPTKQGENITIKAPITINLNATTAAKAMVNKPAEENSAKCGGLGIKINVAYADELARKTMEKRQQVSGVIEDDQMREGFEQLLEAEVAATSDIEAREKEEKKESFFTGFFN